MEITHKNKEENGFFLAEEDGKRMGYLSYEWTDGPVFAIMHTVVEDVFQVGELLRHQMVPCACLELRHQLVYDVEIACVPEPVGHSKRLHV